MYKFLSLYKFINMKRFTFLILIVVCFPINVYAENFFEIEITRISDGDSFNASYQRFPVSVRLYGIDTPELKQEYGKEAKLALEKLLERDNIVIELINLDNYRRAVSIINIDNTTVQEELLKNGHAWFYEQYCKKAICEEWKRLEEEAKKNKLGLWANPNAISPWEYRRKK